MKKHKKILNNIIDFNKYAKSIDDIQRKRLFSLYFYKEKGKYNFSYNLLTHDTKTLDDEFIAYALQCAVEDIVLYSGANPSEILSLTEEIKIRLGFETED